MNTAVRLASLFLAASILCAVPIGGCDTFVSDGRVDSAIAEVQARQSDLDARIAATPDEAEKARLNVELQAANLAAQQLLDIREKLRAATASADSISGTVTAIGSAIPVPGVNTAVALLGSTGILGGIASWLSRQRYAKVANQIIAGIEAAKDPRTNPTTGLQLKAALEAAQPWIHAAMDVGTIESVRRAIKTGRA